MTPAEQLRQRLAQYAGQYGPAATVIGRIKEVDEQAGSCTVDDEQGAPYYGVRLTPVLSGQQNLVLIPATNCYGLMLRLENEEDWYLLWAAQIDKWKLHAAGYSLEVDAEGFKVANATDGLREIMTDLVTEILAIYAPKNVANIMAIQTRINNLLKAK
jgi:hypothetical protein